MKVPDDLVGKMVAIQLVRPVYLFEYSGHAKYDGAELLACQPILKHIPGPGGPGDAENPPQVAATELLLAAIVKQVGPDWIKLALFDPDPKKNDVGNEIHKTIPTALILSIDEVGGTDVEMPVVTTLRRAPESPSKLIL